jgi:hypothetical protein
MKNKDTQRVQQFAMIEQWKSSGLNQRKFCEDNQIAYHVFHYWYGVYRSYQRPKTSFLPVQVQQPEQPIASNIIIKGARGIEVLLPVNQQSIDIIKQLLQS